MVYVRKGLSGVLLNFGGYGGLKNSTLSPFSDIFVYDISSDIWHTQKATGDIPEPRAEFCAGVSAAPDDTSFQVTIHGGTDPYQSQPYNDVYVLTIPSFRWIKINDIGNPDLLGSNSPGRSAFNCDVWNETQLIVSGGKILLYSSPQPNEAVVIVEDHNATSTTAKPQPTDTASSIGTDESHSAQYIDRTFKRYNSNLRINYDNSSNSHMGGKRAKKKAHSADASNTKNEGAESTTSIANGGLLNSYCNETYPPFKALDTSTYTWRTILNSSLEYTVPVLISTVIGGK